MGKGVRGNRGVLKLVHAGGFVEVHRGPVRASDVLARNPRHSLTLPDVFQNPWMVVRPDAELSPGDVFFVVPNRILHRLIQGAAADSGMSY